MKRITAIFLTAVLLFAVPIKTLGVSASAYAVIEQSSGRLLYGKNENNQMTMASTTKVMTALIVIENLDLDKEYDIPDEAVGIEGSSIYLTKGEKLTGRELLYGLMLASGNDAAYALAILTAGSTEAFIDKMNAKANLMGLTNTRFADPCGLKSRNHYTTALDLARLCAYAMNLPTFAQVVATQNYQISGKNGIRYLHNKNRILGELKGGNGIKTGYTTAAGRCLCSSATRNGMQLICVVLNDYAWFEDSKTLLNKGFEEYSMVQLAEKNKICASCDIFGGKMKKCDIIYGKDVFYPLKKGERVIGKTEIPQGVKAPVNKGDVAGKQYYYLNGEKIAQADLVYSESVKKKFFNF